MSGTSILVVGAGGREHAITWACADSCSKITVAPGNGGTAGSLGACQVEQAAATSVPDIVALAQRIKPEVVIVGPEAPLAEGLAGACRSRFRQARGKLWGARVKLRARN